MVSTLLTWGHHEPELPSLGAVIVSEPAAIPAAMPIHDTLDLELSKNAQALGAVFMAQSLGIRSSQQQRGRPGRAALADRHV
jgi:hypothetical protein